MAIVVNEGLAYSKPKYDIKDYKEGIDNTVLDSFNENSVSKLLKYPICL